MTWQDAFSTLLPASMKACFKAEPNDDLRSTMGKNVLASCPCGYKTQFPVGGNRSSFLTISYFPHYCSTCGLVSINVAKPRKTVSRTEKLLRFFGRTKEVISEHTVCCPTCQSADLLPYGKEPLLAANRSPSTIGWDNAYLDRLCNFCPRCNLHTMRCDIASFFD